MTSRCLSNAYMLESRTGFQAFGIAIRCGGSVAYRDLREFVRKLEKEGELTRIRTEVDPILEITEVTQRVTRAKGPALLFERPRGSRVPLLVNAFGSVRRMCLAFEVGALEEVAGGMAGVVEVQGPAGGVGETKNSSSGEEAGWVILPR